MNLIVDMGNTLVKSAVFQKDKLQYKMIFAREDFEKKILENFQSFPQIEEAIFSSVVNDTDKEEEFLEKRTKLLRLTNEVKQPFKNRYTTPASLGRDRIALVAAAVKNYPGKNVLVIDAGTCITYDFKNKAEEYLGGAISPGLSMRFEAMHKFTGNLPLLQRTEEVKLVGNSTETAMNSGVINGTAFEIYGFVNSYTTEYKDLTVILTGGDAQFLLKRLKNGIFADPNFLLEGLNYILEFNKPQ